MHRLQHLSILGLAFLALTFASAAPFGVCFGALCCEDDAEAPCSPVEDEAPCVDSCVLCADHLSPTATPPPQRDSARSVRHLEPVSAVPALVFAPAGGLDPVSLHQRRSEPPPPSPLADLSTTILRN